MVSKDEVMAKLKEVQDPELGVNVVDLGLIYDVEVEGKSVRIRMTLTAIGCPLAYYILGKVKEAVETIPGVESVDVFLTFDPPWSPDMMSEEAKKKLGVTG